MKTVSRVRSIPERFSKQTLVRLPCAQMGGPCFLLLEVAPAADAAATLNASRADEQQKVERTDVKWDLNSIPRKVRRRLTAPRCTDNFAVDPFAVDGELWQSVEQCYQAYKFLDASVRKEIRTMVPHAGESDHSHGMRVWSAGGSSRSKLRSDWDAVKVEVMLRSCRAKYAAHAHLREQLLTTGDVQIIGAPSLGGCGRRRGSASGVCPTG